VLCGHLPKPANTLRKHPLFLPSFPASSQDFFSPPKNCTLTVYGGVLTLASKIIALHLKTKNHPIEGGACFSYSDGLILSGVNNTQTSALKDSLNASLRRIETLALLLSGLSDHLPREPLDAQLVGNTAVMIENEVTYLKNLLGLELPKEK
jgi:hypothetical protein